MGVDRPGQAGELAGDDIAFQLHRAVHLGHRHADIDGGVGEVQLHGEIEIQRIGDRRRRRRSLLLRRQRRDLIRRRVADEQLGKIKADRAGKLEHIDQRRQPLGQRLVQIVIHLELIGGDVQIPVCLSAAPDPETRTTPSP